MDFEINHRLTLTYWQHSPVTCDKPDKLKKAVRFEPLLKFLLLCYPAVQQLQKRGELHLLYSFEHLLYHKLMKSIHLGILVQNDPTGMLSALWQGLSHHKLS